MIGIAVASAFGGMAGLCLAMPRHHRQLWRRTLRRGTSVNFRILGVLGLILAFLSCIVEWGWSMGPVAWFGVVAVAGLVVVFSLPVIEQVVAHRGARSSCDS